MVGNESEENISKDYYYLSTTRHKLGGNHLDSPHGCVLVLDGRKLATNYSGDPIDYWGESFRKTNPRKFEAEDRIWSKWPEIENTTKYVLEAHVLLDLGEDTHILPYELKRLRTLLIACKRKSIPVYVYDDRNSFQHLSKKDALKYSEIPFEKTQKEKFSKSFERDSWLQPWYELYLQKDRTKLSKNAQRTILKLQSFSGYSGFEADFHNAKSLGDLYIPKIVTVMKKQGWKKLKDYYTFLKDKWA